ncbi:MAG: hypothetical protein K8T10_11365 [Candidatus Eremiobacteraeota bacterium]|nr:hypothetical protein [Candidatus Eremiobacteraeota bacterium]
MEKIKYEYFRCIMEDNSQEEYDLQREHSSVIFDQFRAYLKAKGVKEKKAEELENRAFFFIMDYLFTYSDTTNIIAVNKNIIRVYMGNWYIRKFMNPTMKEINASLRAVSSFYTFLHEEGFVSKDTLEEINSVCKDKKWFEMRLKTYHKAGRENFYDWIQEYNYDEY